MEKKNQNIAKSFKWSLYPSCSGPMDGLWRLGEEVEESLHCRRSSNPPLPLVRSITLATMSKDVSSYPPIKPTNFDLIVLGTGLLEFVIATTAASTNGKTVLHTTSVIDKVLRDEVRRKKKGGGGRNVLEFGGSDRKEKKKEGKKKKKRSKGMCGGEKKRGKKKEKKKEIWYMCGG